MPRYFFDTHDGNLINDTVGMEFADINSAKLEAIHRAAWFASDAERLEQAGIIVVTVRDDTEKIVLSVKLVCSIEFADHISNC